MVAVNFPVSALQSQDFILFFLKSPKKWIQKSSEMKEVQVWLVLVFHNSNEIVFVFFYWKTCKNPVSGVICLMVSRYRESLCLSQVWKCATSVLMGVFCSLSLSSHVTFTRVYSVYAFKSPGDSSGPVKAQRLQLCGTHRQNPGILLESRYLRWR